MYRLECHFLCILSSTFKAYVTNILSEYLWIDSDYLRDIMNTCEDSTEKNVFIEETSLPSVRCTRPSNVGQVSRKDRQGQKGNEENEAAIASDHIEIHEDIEDAEPTFYNERKVHLELNESPSLSGIKDDETDTARLNNQRKGRL